MWLYAMEEELFQNNNTWELAIVPHGRSPIRCRWVYKVKKDIDENVERFKVHLVVKDYV